MSTVKGVMRNGLSKREPKKVLLFLVTILLITAGCAHKWHPRSIPEIELKTLGKFEGSYSVALLNDQPEKKLQLFGGAAGHTHWADYNEWTNFFINAYTNELKKEG